MGFIDFCTLSMEEIVRYVIRAILSTQVELAEKRAPLEERKRKRHDEDAGEEASGAADKAKERRARSSEATKAGGTAAEEGDEERPHRGKADGGAKDKRDSRAKGKGAEVAGEKKGKRASARVDPLSAAEKASQLEKHRLIRAVAIGNLDGVGVTAAAIAQASKLGKVCRCIHGGCSGTIRVSEQKALQFTSLQY